MSTDLAHLQRLLAWTSPSYPIGAFSYSHGLEQAVEDGAVHDGASLADYICATLERGCGWIDAVLFIAAFRTAGDVEALNSLCDEASAWRATSELSLESRQQGAAFLSVTRRAWPHPALDALAERRNKNAVPHAIVVALACAAHKCPLNISLEAYLHGFAANLVSAGVRLIPLGQTDGQIALAALTKLVSDVAARAQTTDLEQLGSSTLLLDIASMRHETQYTRLFRS